LVGEAELTDTQDAMQAEGGWTLGNGSRLPNFYRRSAIKTLFLALLWLLRTLTRVAL
jgi:hypothetical protein